MPNQTPEPLTAAADLKVRAEEFLADAAETPDIEIEVRNGLTAYEDQLRNAPELVQAMLDALERSKASNKTLGDIVSRLNDMALDATGLHHLINEDRDGDWQAVWENLGDLGHQLEVARQWAAWFAAERDYILRALHCMEAERAARTTELEASQPFPDGYVTGFLNDQDRVTGLEHVSYPTRVQAVERAEYRRPSIPGVAVYALRKVSE